MKRTLCALSSLVILAGLHAGEPALELDKLRQQPIATGNSKVEQLLRQWWKEGTAAGNAGDFYDNRDGDHSPLSLAPFPQMSAIKYSADEIAARRHWAAQHKLLPHVTFGNSSTSAPAHLTGSNPRSYYVSPSGLLFLYNQYTRNNLYIYPEHRDHDPGHNGRGPRGEEGYGDLYPTNTPYLIISQGSSGSDQPFMRMLPRVLAAFRPDVKKKLAETGLLMPTIQMLLRRTYKDVKNPEDYLTAKAHPTVFEGPKLNELAMVQQAHEIDLKTLPPMVQLSVIDEDKAVNGIDYFDTYPSEVLGYTPCCIARIHRRSAYRQRIVVSAAASFDVNKRPLTYTWVVLRGNPHKIKIVPKKEDQSVAEITVAYHERGSIAPGSAMDSNRVDIGVFVSNGVHYSAPAFITFFSLDRESRVYGDDGKLLAIGHGMGEPELRVTNWNKLLVHLSKDALAAELLKLSKDDQGLLEHFADVYQKRTDAIAAAQAKEKEADAVWKAAKEPADKDRLKKALDLARQDVAAAQKKANEFLQRPIDPLGGDLRSFFEARTTKLTRSPLFTQLQEVWFKKRNTPAIKSAWDKLRRLGIANKDNELTPLLPGKSLGTANWTAFELAHLEWLHCTLLAELAFPGMTQVEWRANFVDRRLSAPREWRDVYRYDPKGELIGWRRYSADGSEVFNHEGLLAVETDAQGRVVKGRAVRYVQDPPKAKSFAVNPLRMVPGDTIVRYEFADGDDWRGRRMGTEPVMGEKK